MIKCLILSACLAVAAFPQAYDDPSRVLVIYRTNQSDADGNGQSDSKDLAEYYQAKRGIPAANLLGVSTPAEEMYHPASTLNNFYANFVTPLRNKLTELGETEINFIVLCKGIPYRMASKSSGSAVYPVGQQIAAIWAIGNDSASSTIGSVGSNPMYESSPGVGSDKGAFNHDTYKIYNGTNMYLVTHLNGSSFQNSKELVDRALYAEKYLYPDSSGTLGYYSPVGYVDTRYGYYNPDSLLAHYPVGYGSYGTADKDMSMGKRYIEQAGFKCRWEYSGSEIGESAALFQDGATSALTAPNAIFYGGWYNFMQYRTNTWTWMPGALACDLNSNSFSSTYSVYSFGSMAMVEGATAVSGVIDEPYLNGHTQPEKFLYYIMQGANYAEIAYHSDPRLGWKTWNVGDPLYRPLAVDKTPVVDDVPPPAPAIAEAVPGDDFSTRNFIISINTNGLDPDLVLVKLEYGETDAYGTTVDYSRFYRMKHTIALTGLTTDMTYHYRVTLKDPMGNETATEDLMFTTSPVSGESGVESLAAVSLSVFPNPFNPSTTIRFYLPISGKVTLDVCAVSGKRVARLLDEERKSGVYEVSFAAGANLPSGIYICHLKTGRLSRSVKLMLTR
ncbi:MAG: hypothetical protein A2293_04605 [Elusimicrobia bacterium RIFOXYB2_FULL_49_7]|nr:MAG: hypothetical protein A2293_04605 [Elusimicrobia bacterium RIFOXYB2_FULL_49_7]